MALNDDILGTFQSSLTWSPDTDGTYVVEVAAYSRDPLLSDGNLLYSQPSICSESATRVGVRSSDSDDPFESDSSTAVFVVVVVLLSLSCIVMLKIRRKRNDKKGWSGDTMLYDVIPDRYTLLAN